MALAALIVAVVAATIAVLTFGWTIGWSIWQHRQLTRPKIKLRASFGFLPNLPNIVPLVLTGTNVGHVTVTLTGAKVTLRGADKHLALIAWVVQTPQPLPIVLESGKSWTGIVNSEDISRGLSQLGVSRPWEVRVVVTDAADVEYASGPVKFT